MDKKGFFAHIGKLLPRILYFPNFLFDFPDKVYLEDTDIDKDKHQFYSTVIQDILNSLENDLNIDTHIVKRARSDKSDDKKNLNNLLLKMSRHVTEKVFGAWKEIFSRNIDQQISIRHDIDSLNKVYLEFNVIDSDGEYLIGERSLGFRWFFVFFLLTHFRRYRKGTPENVIFLFDEPASNLHSTAQTQLLASLERLSQNCTVIYTTHSHHLINTSWLEGAFVVVNSGIGYNNDLKEMENYRTP